MPSKTRPRKARQRCAATPSWRPPRYYAITADDTRIEVSASHWGAVHRYTFEGDAPRLVELDLQESRGDSIGGEITALSDTEWRGFAEFQVHPLVARLVALGGEPNTGEFTVYWALSVSQAPVESAGWRRENAPEALPVSGSRAHAAMVFSDDTSEVTLRLGLSLRDTDTAAAHRDALPNDLDLARQAAEDTWNTRLNRVQAQGQDRDLRRFYTALYHSMFQPADYSEDGVFVSA